MLETNIFIKDTTKILANISKQICKHNASLFNWQHFEKNNTVRQHNLNQH